MVSDDSEFRSSSAGTEPTISRRGALGASVVATISLSGCLDSLSPASSDDGGDETPNERTDSTTNETDDPNASENSGPDEDPAAVVTTYLEAALDEDLDRMSELTHSRNPIDPAALVEEGWEFLGGGDEADLERIEIDVVKDNAVVEDVLELEGAEYWFEDDEVREELAAERLARVEITGEEPGSNDAVWILATEGGEWRYLFQAPLDETPENPEELFEEPIEDEDNDVVVDIDWEYESEMSDVPQAAVELTDERGISANRIEIESTIEGASTGAYDRDDEDFTATWEGVTLYVPYDPDGDQIVVTAMDEDANESTVVHREHNPS